MLERRSRVWLLTVAAIVAVGISTYVWQMFKPMPLIGVWTNQNAYDGAEPGTLLIRVGASGMTIDPCSTAPLWWASRTCELDFDPVSKAVNVWSGSRNLGRLMVKIRNGEMAILDGKFPTSTLRLTRSEFVDEEDPN